jgi:Bifunctional DNA primase/polymerase, N-terminal
MIPLSHDPSEAASLRDAALIYASWGWRVLPCQPLGKDPITHLVPHAVYDATADPDTIRGWWSRYPNANIGVAGGNGLLLVDLDLDKNANALRDLELLIGVALPPTRIERTPSGGLHYFYMVPADEELNGLDPITGVELRYTGRYVIVAPSILALGHPGVRKAGTYELV